MRRIALTLVVTLACAAGVLPACGGKTTGAVDYSVSAQKNYEKGLAELQEKDWIAAAKYFSFIKSRFPYSKYAVLAELRLADAEFGAEQYLESIDSYKLFAKFHPTHEMVVNGYASFRIGEAYYKMLPGDFWILPPSYEKDQSSTEDAEDQMRRFLEKFPDSPYSKRAAEILAKVGKRLAAHEWYVARYYWDRKKPMGTVLRLRHLLEQFPGVGYDEEAMWLLGRAYLAVDMPDRARQAWGELVEKYPKAKRASEAREAIARLPAPAAAAPDAPAPAPAPPPKATPAPE
ncbi:MAG: outer membrane protein assembly factor BamD [Kofleriaceae bacterium]|nr:outer membrane protein assembly factor BamD [Kofleriaceae bacterium]MCB9570637.1 outer membrane protein assembly factor BamD [Kofleriaceae bacterium]